MDRQLVRLMLMAGTLLCLASFTQGAFADKGAPSQKIPAKKDSKSKPKKNVKKSVDDFGPMDLPAVSRENQDFGIGVHRNQVGIDRPYSIEMAASSEISSTQKEESNQSKQTSKGTNVKTTGELCMLFGRAEVGVNIDYQSSSEKVSPIIEEGDKGGQNSGGQQTIANQPSDYSSSLVRLGLGPVIKYNFGNIDLNITVPFVYGGFVYALEDIKAEGAAKVSFASQTVRFGVGVHLFLTSNVTFAPKIEYQRYQAKSEKAGTIKSAGPKLLFQFGIFI